MKVSTSKKAGIKGGVGWGGNGEVEWSVIDRWPTHEGLVQVRTFDGATVTGVS
jgi:hypothetical protein